MAWNDQRSGQRNTDPLGKTGWWLRTKSEVSEVTLCGWTQTGLTTYWGGEWRADETQAHGRRVGRISMHELNNAQA